MPSARRSVPVAAAVVGIVLVPAVVGEVTSTSPSPVPSVEPDAPKVAEAALTARLEPEETSTDNQALLHLQVAGPPPSEASTLTGNGGLDTVETRPTQISECAGVPPRRIASGEQSEEWCLELVGIEGGQQVTGKLAGEATTLTLTVNRRDPFLILPFLVAFGGLILGALVSLLPPWLRNRVRSGLLQSALRQNDAAGEEAKIACLSKWVELRQQENDSDDTLLPVVTRTQRDGPAKARAARSELAKALAKSPLQSHDYVEAAKKEAETTTHKAANFLKDDGTELEQHPARAWLLGLNELQDVAVRLDELERQIGELPDPSKPRESLAKARAAFDSANEHNDPAGLATKVQEVEEAIALQRPMVSAKLSILDLTSAVYAFPREVPSEPEPVTRPAPAISDSPITAVRQAKRDLIPWAVATVAIGLAILGWAILTLNYTLYETKDAFGAWKDYFALLVGAIGSGAAGAVIGLVALWNPLRPTEE